MRSLFLLPVVALLFSFTVDKEDNIRIIPVGKQFEIGRSSDKQFEVTVTNKSDITVWLVAKAKDGSKSIPTQVPSKKKATVELTEKQYLVVQNRGEVEAKVKFLIIPGVDGMSFEMLEELGEL